MFKWIEKLGNWLSEHALIWGWEKGYQSTVHLVWTWVTIIAMIVMKFTLADITLGFSILFGGGQILAFVQELIRMFVARRRNSVSEVPERDMTPATDTGFRIDNVFSSIIGLVIGGFIAGIIWWIIR